MIIWSLVVLTTPDDQRWPLLCANHALTSEITKSRWSHDLVQLAERDAVDLVFAEVDAGGVAAEGHVEGELVQLEVVPLAVELRRRSMGDQAASSLAGVTAAVVWSSATRRAGR